MSAEKEVPPAELYARKLLEQFPPSRERRTFRYGQQPHASYPHLIVAETHMAHAQMRVEEGLRFSGPEVALETLDALAKLIPGSERNVSANTVEMPAIPQHDAVNHPRHYNDHPSGVECIDIVEHFSFNVGNAVKYLWRAGLKPGATELDDLRKAEWYISRELDRLLSEGGHRGR